MVHEEQNHTPEEVDQSIVDGPIPEAPAVGPNLRKEQQIADALAATPGGEKLDSYFGISSGEPEQSPAEAQQAGELIDQLRDVTSTGSGDLAELLSKISEHANDSGADPEALRALMRGTRKPLSTEQNDSEG